MYGMYREKTKARERRDKAGLGRKGCGKAEQRGIKGLVKNKQVAQLANSCF